VNARDLTAGLALTIGIAGAVSAWADRPGSVDVPAGRSDAGTYVVQPLIGAAPISTADGGSLQPVAEFETRGRVLHIERFKPYQSLVTGSPACGPPRMTSGSATGP
jgi:hypothetical protein